MAPPVASSLPTHPKACLSQSLFPVIFLLVSLFLLGEGHLRFTWAGRTRIGVWTKVGCPGRGTRMFGQARVKPRFFLPEMFCLPRCPPPGGQFFFPYPCVMERPVLFSRGSPRLWDPSVLVLSCLASFPSFFICCFVFLLGVWKGAAIQEKWRRLESTTISIKFHSLSFSSLSYPAVLELFFLSTGQDMRGARGGGPDHWAPP